MSHYLREELFIFPSENCTALSFFLLSRLPGWVLPSITAKHKLIFDTPKSLRKGSFKTAGMGGVQELQVTAVTADIPESLSPANNAKGSDEAHGCASQDIIPTSRPGLGNIVDKKGGVDWMEHFSPFGGARALLSGVPDSVVGRLLLYQV